MINKNVNNNNKGDERIAQIIGKTRNSMGKEYSQEKMAELLGLETRQAYANIENGKRALQFKHIPKLCEIFDCDVGYLFGEYPTKKRDTADIQEATGLSEKSIETLKKLNSIPEMGTDITDNIFRLKALDFLLSDENGILTLKLIGEYLFGDYEPYYDELYTLEDVEQDRLDDNLWQGRRQEYSDLTDEEFYEFMQKNAWVNYVPLSKNERPVPEPISIDDIKASVLVRVNQALGDCYKYLRNDAEGKIFLKHVKNETVTIYNERLEDNKKLKIESKK